MATVSAGDIGLNFDNFDLGAVSDPVDVQRSETFLRVEWEYYSWFDFIGKDFEYGSGGVPVKGTVTRLESMDFGEKDYSISGFEYSIKKMFNVAFSSSDADDFKMLKDILSGDDTITGNNKVDRAYGFSGDDKLSGLKGIDILYGDGGDDILIGGRNGDEMHGGDGADIFVYKTVADSKVKDFDKIYDFSHKDGDKFDLEALGNLNFIGNHKFHGDRMELRYESSGGITSVEVDTNGDKEAELHFEIAGKIALKEADFLL